MQKTKKKILASILAFLMVFTTIPVYALEGIGDTSAPVSQTQDLEAEITESTILGGTLTFSDSGIEETVQGQGYTIEGTTLEINSAGVYTLTGECSEGSVKVKASTTGVVLVLDSLNLASTTTAPIEIKKNADVRIHLNGNNSLTDAEPDPSAEGAEGAAIKVKSGANLLFCGQGELEINGSAKNGIKGAANAIITFDNGNYLVSAVNNGIASDGELVFNGGTFNINAQGDAIKSNPEDTDSSSEGRVTILGGNFEINSDSDGINAEQILIEAGNFNIVTAGGSDAPFDKETSSAKGIKASTDRGSSLNIEINGGTFTLNCADDCIHSDGSISIIRGVFDINSGDDAIHADGALNLGSSGGLERDPEINIQSSVEGMEGGEINIDSGRYYIFADDDAINAAEDGQRNTLIINDCNMFIICEGDGLDSNSNMYLNGGFIEIFSRSSEPESIMDTNGNQMFISGATVFGAGLNSKNDVSPAGSSQPYIILEGSFSNGNTVSVIGEDEAMIYGTTILKDASFLFYSSPSLSGNETLGLTDASVANMGGSWSHNWYVASQTSDTITYASDTTDKTESQSVFNTEDIICNGHEPEIQEIQELVTTFDCDEGVKQINVFYTQDYATLSETDVQTAIARNSSTGRIDDSGNGQVNFEIVLNDGYELTSVEVTPAESFNQLKDMENNIYRITKVSGDNTVTITTTRTEEPGPQAPDPYDFTVTFHALDGHFENGTDTNVLSYTAVYEQGTDGEGNIHFDPVASLAEGTYEEPVSNTTPYVFKGWHLNEDLSDEIVTDLNFVEDAELYAEYSIQDFHLSMVYYNSRVDGGRTVLNHNTPCIFEATSLNDTLTLQINYESDSLSKDYEPGEFSFKVYGLEKFGLKRVNIANNIFSYTHHTGTYNYDENIVEDDYYIFTNKTKLTAETTVEGMVQMVYSLANSTDACPYNESSGEVYAVFEDQQTIPLHFEFDLAKRTFNANLTTDNIQSYDDLGENPDDYLWVKYMSSCTGQYQNWMLDTTQDGIHAKFNFPEGSRIFYSQSTSGNGNRVVGPTYYELTPSETRDGQDYYDIPMSQYGNYTFSLFVGYPKSSFNVGDSVNATVEYYNKYYRKYASTPDDEDVLLDSATSAAKNLVEYTDPAIGNLVSWQYYKFSYYDRLSTSVICRPNIRGHVESYSQIKIFNKRPVDVRYGIDLMALQDLDSQFELLEDEGVYIVEVSIPTYLKNVNGAVAQSDEYDINLYVRYQGEDEYVLYKTYKNSGTSYTRETIDASKKVTAFYWEIKDLDRTLMLVDISDTKANVEFTKADGTFKRTGQISGGAYLMIFDSETQELMNIPPVETEYPVNMQSMEIPQKDIDEYGSLLMRRELIWDIKPDEMCATGELDAMGFTRNEGSTVYNVESTIRTKGSNSTMMSITAYDSYIDFPVQLRVPTLAKIKDATHEWMAKQSNLSYMYTNMSYAEKVAYLEKTLSCLTMETIDNVDGNGTTRLHFNWDFGENTDIEGFKELFTVIIPITVYDADIIDYGGIIEVNQYHKPVLQEGEGMVFYNGSSGSSAATLFNIRQRDEGERYVDTKDINNNNDTSELFFRNYAQGNLTAAFDSQQELSKLTKTDKNFFKNGASNTSADTDYTYRLRVRTAATSMTNLVVYDVLENHNPDNKQTWQGEFVGIDLSRSESQGWVPEVYYSTSVENGKLGEDSNWLPYNDTVDKTTVKALAFDYGEQVIQPNAIASVDIIMHSPNEELDYFAYNRFNAEWNRVDPATDYVFPNKESLVSNSTILAVGEDIIIADTKTISTTKEWQGEPDDFAQRPESITVNLYRDGELVSTKSVTADDDWEAVFDGLEAFADNGHEYVYTVTENVVDNYVSEVDNETYTITNTYNLQNIEGQKNWVGDTEEKRPDSITVNLLRNGETVDSKTVTANDEWKYVFENVEIMDEDKVPYEYSVEEEPVDKYITSYPEDSEYDITNTFNAHDISGEKHWVDDNEDMRPESVTIKLMLGDEVIDTKTVTANDEWKYVFEDVLTLDENGVAYDYSIEEEPVEGYTTSYGTSDNDKYDVYNTFINSQNIEGEKIWIGDTEDKRPESITVKLYQNGEDTGKTATADAGTGWKYVFEDVEILDENKALYEYSVEEVEIDRYIVQYATSATSTEPSDTPQSGYFTIINTYDPPKSAEIRFVKTIQGEDEDWAKLALNKNDTYSFKIKLTNNETGEVIQGVLTNKGVLSFGNVPLGTYTVSEADDIYFEFVSMIGRGQLSGVTFDGTTLTVGEGVPENGSYTIDVTNKLNAERYQDDKDSKDNLLAFIFEISR